MIAIKEHFKKTAALVGDPVRATILWTLLDGKAFTATELALSADTSASNMSMHLSKLVHAGLLKATKHGRYRYYSYSGDEMARAVESLGALIPYFSGRLPPVQKAEPGILQCRTCYDHLAGKTGVAITDALFKKKFIVSSENRLELTPRGKKWFVSLGIPVEDLQQQRRSFLRPCLDWSERRYHIAGSLAAALAQRMLQEDWIRKIRNSRAVVVTAKGQKILHEVLTVEVS